ncbi:MAG: hypothetical protein JRJ49_06585, partial [Deltaproteobacteria bacterium]|nr:hypothetical protein [Deltaproteobacteria bacterium]
MKKIIFYILFGLVFIVSPALAADQTNTENLQLNRSNSHHTTGAITISDTGTYTNLGTINIHMRIEAIVTGNPLLTLYGIKHGGSVGNKRFLNQGSATITGRARYDSLYGIYLGDAGNNEVINSSGAHIDISTRQEGIYLGNGNNLVDNQGSLTIYTSVAEGIEMGSGNDIFRNSGDHYVSITSAGHSIYLGNGDNLFENTGNSLNITTTGSGSYGILSGTGDDNLTNSGVLNINAEAQGIVLGEGNDILTNSGIITIDAEDEDGIDFGDGNNILTNTVTGDINITSGDNGITFGSGDDNLTNSGIITIDAEDEYGIYFGDGNNIFNNTAGDINITSGSAGDGIAFGSGADSLISA